MCFSLSLQIFARLSEMWNGRVVYQRHWHIFFKDMRADWMRIAATVSLRLIFRCRIERGFLTFVHSPLSSGCS